MLMSPTAEGPAWNPEKEVFFLGGCMIESVADAPNS